jgi:hypothetical protein
MASGSPTASSQRFDAERRIATVNAETSADVESGQRGLKQDTRSSDLHPMKKWRLPTAVLVIGLLLTACGGRGAAPSADRPERPSLPDRSHNGREQNSDDSDVQQHESEVDATKGDMKTFAYASTDAAKLAAEVTAVAAPGGASSTHYEGYELVDEAERLERLSSEAAQRLKGTNPSNKVLVRARKDGIAAFSLTADYARLMYDLAIADQTDNLELLNEVATDALALEGTGQQLADDYTALIAELEGWSRAHPQAAAKALAKYGK